MRKKSSGGNDVECEINGKVYRGTYQVYSGMLTVNWIYGSKSAVPGSNPQTIAMLLLCELVEDEHRHQRSREALQKTSISDFSQNELDEFLTGIDSGKYGEATYKPERLPSEKGRDIISIPNKNGTTRWVYERKHGEQWKKVPFVGGKSLHE